MVTQSQLKDALKIIADYAAQVEKKENIGTHTIGCRVKLSEWGLEMQGKQKRKLTGVVIEMIPGIIDKISDGSVCVKWNNIKMPSWMHISQVEKL